MKRACVFVDGENFRHSLKHLFHSGRYSFGTGDYLPETDWHAFFTSLANRFECELLRVYWYVIEHIGDLRADRGVAILAVGRLVVRCGRQPLGIVRRLPA